MASSSFSRLPLLDTTMESPFQPPTSAQYVYVPNLVGGQMLRLCMQDVSAQDDSAFAYSPIDSPTLSSRYIRSSSPSPSLESVDEEK